MSISSQKRKMYLPLRMFEKFQQLTQIQVAYLTDYKERVKGNKKLEDRIDKLLKKPKIEGDSIFDYDKKLDVIYSHNWYKNHPLIDIVQSRCCQKEMRIYDKDNNICMGCYKKIKKETK